MNCILKSLGPSRIDAYVANQWRNGNNLTNVHWNLWEHHEWIQGVHDSTDIILTGKERQSRRKASPPLLPFSFLIY